MNDDKLIKTIVDHEGYRQFEYKDTLGFSTIGIGRCIEHGHGPGISIDEAMYLLNNDIKKCEESLSDYHWFNQLDDVRKGVMLELSFNMGVNGLLTFKNTLASITLRDYSKAAEHLLDSKWATQVGKSRVDNICYRLKYGIYP